MSRLSINTVPFSGVEASNSSKNKDVITQKKDGNYSNVSKVALGSLVALSVLGVAQVLLAKNKNINKLSEQIQKLQNTVSITENKLSNTESALFGERENIKKLIQTMNNKEESFLSICNNVIGMLLIHKYNNKGVNHEFVRNCLFCMSDCLKHDMGCVMPLKRADIFKYLDSFNINISTSDKIGMETLSIVDAKTGKCRSKGILSIPFKIIDKMFSNEDIEILNNLPKKGVFTPEQTDAYYDVVNKFSSEEITNFLKSMSSKQQEKLLKNDQLWNNLEFIRS